MAEPMAQSEFGVGMAHTLVSSTQVRSMSNSYVLDLWDISDMYYLTCSAFYCSLSGLLTRISISCYSMTLFSMVVLE